MPLLVYLFGIRKVVTFIVIGILEGTKFSYAFISFFFLTLVIFAFKLVHFFF